MEPTFNPPDSIRLEWLNLLYMSNELLDYESLCAKNFDLALASHAFFTLRGEQIFPTPEGICWKKLREHSEYPQIVSTMVDTLSTINAVLHLTTLYIQYFIPDDVKDNAENATVKDRKELKTKTAKQQQQLKTAPTLSNQNPKQTDNGGNSEGETTDAGEGETTDAGEGAGVVVVVDIADEDLDVETLEAVNQVTCLLVGLFAGDGYVPTVEKLRRLEDMRGFLPIRQLSELLGNLKRVADSALRQSKSQTGATVDTNLGAFGRNTRFLDRAGVSAGNITELAKFGDNSFSNRKREDITPTGLGDIDFIRDESSSMLGRYTENRSAKKLTGAANVTPYAIMPVRDARRTEKFQTLDKDEQAFNLEVALAAVAASQGRRLVSYPFDSGKLREFDYRSSYEDWKKHATQFFNGGTRITHVLKHVLQNGHGKNRDILIGTDGQIDDDPRDDPEVVKLLATFRKNGGNIWVMYIGEDYDTVAWADFTIHVKDLLSVSGDLFKLFVKLNTDRSSGRKAF